MSVFGLPILLKTRLVLNPSVRLGDSVSNFYLDPPFTFPLGIKDKPFHARYERIALEKLPDAQTVRQERHGAIYRASDGRSRTVKYEKDKMTEIEAIIHDPVQGKAYFLDPESQTSYGTGLPGAPSGAAAASFEEVLIAVASSSNDLGREVVEGFVCRGYGVTAPGGDTLEYWVSEELSAVLLAKNLRDNEEITFCLYDIERIEPESTLFAVPADYEDAS